MKIKVLNIINSYKYDKYIDKQKLNYVGCHDKIVGNANKLQNNAIYAFCIIND